jgi:hypothetical protein
MKKYFENKIAFRQKLQKKINKEFSWQYHLIII